ncbi:unnamed protein product [Discula destructiva]
MHPLMACFWLFSLIVLVHGGAANFSQSTAMNTTLPPNDFNACDGTDGYMPILYHNYTGDDCPPPNNRLTDDGRQCYFGKYGDIAHNCDAYCQLYTYFEYALEVPFPMSYCNYPLECSLSASYSASWTWGISFSTKVGKALKIGISGSYSQAYGTTTGRSWSFTPAEGQCGYFSFVPIKKIACGIYSESTFSYSHFYGYYCKDDVRTSVLCPPQVWNVPQPSGSSGPDGTVIFVNTDCDTRQPLDAEHQDKVYRHPGVPLDRGVAAAMQQGWANNTCSFHTSPAPSPGSDDYTVEIFGKGMLPNSVGLNGSTLMNSIAWSCGTSADASYAFLWYGAVDAAVAPMHVSLPDGSILPSVPPLVGAEFGALVKLTMASGYSGQCIGDALITAGAVTTDQCGSDVDVDA